MKEKKEKKGKKEWVVPRRWWNELPVEICSYIYQYDSTYRSVMTNVLEKIASSRWVQRRLEKDLQRLEHDPEVLVLKSNVKCFFTTLSLVYRKRVYQIQYTVDCPVEPPRVVCEERILSPIENWTPIACTKTVLVTCDKDISCE